MSIEEKFDVAMQIVEKLPKDDVVGTSTAEQSKFYSLYMQATVGDVNIEKDDAEDELKWESWKNLEGVSKNDAMKRYIEALETAFDDANKKMDILDWFTEVDPSIEIFWKLLRDMDE